MKEREQEEDCPYHHLCCPARSVESQGERVRVGESLGVGDGWHVNIFPRPPSCFSTHTHAPKALWNIARCWRILHDVGHEQAKHEASEGNRGLLRPLLGADVGDVAVDGHVRGDCRLGGPRSHAAERAAESGQGRHPEKPAARQERGCQLERQAHIIDHVSKKPPLLHVRVHVPPKGVAKTQATDHAETVAKYPLHSGRQWRRVAAPHAGPLEHGLGAQNASQIAA
eukprot:scaffold2210_cov316-Pinguiococcus_pyrenoidosus.AAC.7